LVYEWATSDPEESIAYDFSDSFIYGVFPQDIVRNSVICNILRSDRIINVLLALSIVSFGLSRYNFTIFEIPDVLILLLSIGMLVRIFNSGTVIINQGALVSAILFTALLCWLSIATIINSSPVGALVQRFEYWTLFGVILLYVDDNEDVHRLLQYTAISALIWAAGIFIATVLTLPTEPVTLQPRSLGGIHMPVARARPVLIFFGVLGIILTFPLGYLFIRLFRTQTKKSATAVLIIILAIVFTQSRTAYLALGLTIIAGIIASILFICLQKSNIWRRLVSFIVLITIPFAVAISLLISRALIMVNSRSLTVRIEQYQAAVSIMINQPLFGVGPGRFLAETIVENLVHNAWLRLGAVAGIPALLLLMLIIYLAVRQIVQTATHGCPDIPLSILMGGVAVAVGTSFQASSTHLTWLALAAALQLQSD
jgi:O-antigen ligase